MSIKEKIIDSLHWKQYWFIGQDNAIFEGSLTQESEEQIADQIRKVIASSLPDMSKEEIMGAICANPEPEDKDLFRPMDAGKAVFQAHSAIIKKWLEGE